MSASDLFTLTTPTDMYAVAHPSCEISLRYGREGGRHWKRQRYAYNTDQKSYLFIFLELVLEKGKGRRGTKKNQLVHI